MTRQARPVVPGFADAAYPAGEPWTASFRREDTRTVALLERETQLGALGHYAEEALSGRGRLVLVSGDAGVGKSTLLETFEHDLPGARWCWGACDGAFTPRPLGPLRDIAETLGGDLLTLVESSARRDELFAALLRQIDDSELLTVCVIEDVHWADEATLDLLRYLARRIRERASLVLVSYRDDALAATDPLRIVVGDLATGRATRRISVPPLSPDAVGRLATDATISAAELYRLTGGNPFFVTEVLRAGVIGIPPSARDAVLARVARMSGAARDCAETAALAGGTRVSPTLLESVVEASTQSLDELVASGILVVDGTVLRFRHEITRWAIEREVPAHRRRFLHSRLLEVLEASGETDQARLAYHAEGAGDREAVLRLAPRAGARAAEMGAHREAARQYRRALRFCEQTPTAVAADLHEHLAIELSLDDGWEEAAEEAELALSLWRAVGDASRESDVLTFLSRVMWRLCRSEQMSYAEAAVEVATPLGGAVLGRAAATLATACSDFGDQERTVEWGVRAVALAERNDLPDVLADALIALGNGDLGQWPWEATLLRALDVAVAARLEGQAGRAFGHLQAVLIHHKRFDEAERLYLRGEPYCEEHDIATWGNCLSSHHGLALCEQGRWDEAVAICRSVLARSVISPENKMAPAIVLGQLLARRGEAATAQALLDVALGSALRSGLSAWLLAALPARAEAHWLAGDEEAARRDLATALPHLGADGEWLTGLVKSWLRRVGCESQDGPGPAAPVAEPYRLAFNGEWAAAAAIWDRLGCPYDAALALFDSCEEAGLREALDRFETLGATAAAGRTRHAMRSLGIKSIPAGPRSSTRKSPAGLTTREHEVLELVAAGHTNEEIAGSLFISVKTVDHHVSAVLGKLDVPTRRAAAAKARRQGLLVTTDQAR